MVKFAGRLSFMTTQNSLYGKTGNLELGLNVLFTIKTLIFKYLNYKLEVAPDTNKGFDYGNY